MDTGVSCRCIPLIKSIWDALFNVQIQGDSVFLGTVITRNIRLNIGIDSNCETIYLPVTDAVFTV